MTYTQGFYDWIAPGSSRSASILAPLIVNAARLLIADDVRTAIDVGAGEGHWTNALAQLGISVVGIDGAYVDHRPAHFIEADLEKPMPGVHADLVICLEVGEHLSAERAPSFVAELCEMAPVVAFSAAIPGQVGVGHINCQWPRYWADLFAGRGYHCDDRLRWEVWDNGSIDCWYRQNLLLFSSEIDGDHRVSPVPVVHPGLWETVTG